MEVQNVNTNVPSENVQEVQEVTKDVVRLDLTDQRKKFLTKKIRKLERKHQVLVDELANK